VDALRGTVDHIDVGGMGIAYERRGAGLALVLLHGAFGDSRVWRSQLDGLSDEFTVVAWDAPGCGRSSDPPDTFRASDYAHCLRAFIEMLDLGHPHLLGLSWGAVVALDFFRWHPNIPRTLVLASAYAGWAGSLPAEVVEERRQQAARAMSLPSTQMARESIPGLLTEAASPELREELVAIMSEYHPVGMRVAASAFETVDLRDVLPSIDVPTLLLYGDADQRSPLYVAQDLQAQINGSTLAVIPGAGHLSNVDAPDRFNAEVRRFLRAH
jgi:pimeloyl-ACP methyl ester carboxylesterase